MNAISTVKTLQMVTRHLVMKQLQWDDLQYGEFQMEKGIEYLCKEVGADSWGVSQLSQSTLFWKWWINHWNKRDEQFLSMCKGMDLSERLCFYEELHDADGIEFRPHRIVLEDSYYKSVVEPATRKEAMSER